MTRRSDLLPRVSAVASTLGVVWLTSGAAAAYCREVTVTPPNGYDPVASGCLTVDPEGGGPLPQLFWRNQCVTFNLNRAGSPASHISLDDARRVATDAFSLWSTAACAGGGSPSILATEGPVVDCNAASQAHNNPIIFRDTGWTSTDAANTLGYTTLTVDLDNGEILGAEIEINTENHIVTLASPPPQGAYDLSSILAHEAGHFLGLAHSADSNALMYAYYHSAANGLQPDDVAGICSIYAPDGSRSTATGVIAATSCNQQPLLGFETACGSLDASAFAPVEMPTIGAHQTGDGGLPPLTENLWGCGVAPTHRAGDLVRGLPLLGLALLLRRSRGAERRLPRRRS
jgi:hypothetical protein